MQQNQSSHIKGFIAEELCKFHLAKSGFNIINSGKEWYDQDLANKLIEQKPSSNNHTLNIFNNIIAKLPDMMIWKDGDSDIDYSYVEVKYRKSLDKRYFKEDVNQRNNIPYLNYTVLKDSPDPLNVFKYMKNLENLMRLENPDLDDIKNINFFVYLVVYDDLSNKSNIYLGKAFNLKDKGYKVYFYEPKHVQSYNESWSNYEFVADYILNNNIIKDLYNKIELFANEDYSTIRDIVKNNMFKY